jgi:hypothetical protein
VRFLTERESNSAVRLAKDCGNLLTMALGTGLRPGELGRIVGRRDRLRSPHHPSEQGPGSATTRRAPPTTRPGWPATAAEAPCARPPCRQSEDSTVAAHHYRRPDSGGAADDTNCGRRCRATIRSHPAAAWTHQLCAVSEDEWAPIPFAPHLPPQLSHQDHMHTMHLDQRVARSALRPGDTFATRRSHPFTVMVCVTPCSEQPVRSGTVSPCCVA